MHALARQVNLLISVVAVTVLTGCQQQMMGNRTTDQPSDGVFVHITHGSENAHAVLMGLKMANLMAKDRDVLVYFDLQGVHVVLKDAPDLTLAPFDSSHKQLQDLLAKNVRVYVCPGCLSAAGKTEADVMKGIAVAEKDAFFDFTEGRILTIDY
jgi:predicted peroxiredoxin